MDSNNLPSCPECERLKAVSEISNAQGDFVRWLIDKKDFRLGKWDESERGNLLPVYFNANELLAEYHGIDLNKVEAERRELLRHLGNTNA